MAKLAEMLLPKKESELPRLTEMLVQLAERWKLLANSEKSLMAALAEFLQKKSEQAEKSEKKEKKYMKKKKKRDEYHED